MIRILYLILIVFLIGSCTASTGQLVKKEEFNIASYEKQNQIYIYRPKCSAAMMAKIIIELNNNIIGVLGNKETINVTYDKKVNVISAFGDLNQRNYSITLDTEDFNSKYLIATYCDPLIGLKVNEIDYKDWIEIISEDF